MSGATAAALPAAPTGARDLRHTALALAVLVAWELSGLDLVLAGWFGSSLGFPARDAWWSRSLLHDGGRWLSAVGLLAAVVAAWRGVRNDPLRRRQRLAWLLAVGCALVLVPALKRFSATSCPWDLTLFGATVPYVSHWARMPDGGPGHCFPSGHAVAAFAFLPLYFQWRAHRPTLARAILVTAGVAGALFGVAQLARGAHFPSHTFWSAWLCWCVGVLAARLIRVRNSARAPTLPNVWAD